MQIYIEHSIKNSSIELIEEDIDKIALKMPTLVSYDPFITIGFYVAGFDSSGNPLSADVSNWQGICIAFSLSGAPADVQLSMGDSLDEAMGYALPEEVLGKSYGRSSCFEWSDFLQPTWKSKDALTVSGEEAARRLVKVIIRIQGKSGLKGEFIIQGIGTNI